jgi:hypothetical protein
LIKGNQFYRQLSKAFGQIGVLGFDHEERLLGLYEWVYRLIYASPILLNITNH